MVRPRRDVKSQIGRVLAGILNRRTIARTLTATGVFGVLVTAIFASMPNGTAMAGTGINQQINFQGKLVNTDGTNIADGTYNMEFNIYTGGNGCVSSGSSPCGGTLQWTEDYLRNNSQGVSVSAGIFQVSLGSITALPTSIFNNDTIWMSINLGNTNATCTPFSSCGGDGEMLPFIRYTAAPYAFNSLQLGGLTASQFAQLSPASAQSGSLNVTGSVQAATSLQAPLVDTATGVALDIGTGTATSVTIGRTSTPFTIQGSNTSTLTSTASGHTTTIGFTSPTVNSTLNFTSSTAGTYTICTSEASTCSGTYSTTGGGTFLAKNSADTSAAAITAGNYLYGFTNSQATATTGGVLDLSNGANTGNTLYVTASGNPAASTNALIVANNTAASPSGNLLDLQKAGANQLSVDYQGNITQVGGTTTTDTINGQTISSAANFTGTVTAATSVLAPLFDTASAGTLSVGTGTATTINVGSTGSAAQTIAIGSSTGANTISLGNGAIASGTDTISIGSGATSSGVDALTLGSTNSTSSTLIQGGVNGTNATLSLQVGSAGYIGIGTVNANTIQEGSVGTSINSSTVQIANTTNATGTQSVTIGSTANTANIVTLQGGATTESIANAGDTITNASSTTAFQVSNGTNDLVQVDTANNNIDLGGNNSGNLQSWSTSANNLPSAVDRIYGTSVYANGYIYLLGGSTNSNIAQATNTVFYTQVNTDGSIGSWNTNANTLPGTVGKAASVVANGYVYVLGGDSGAATLSSVWYAKLNSDGTTGTWQTAANSLPAAREGETAAVANGYIYAIGGGATSVYYAKLNADGSVGAWSTAANVLPASRSNGVSVVANGYLYWLGGNNTAVYYSLLGSNGAPGTWSTATNPLPTALTYAIGDVANGYVYYIGGTTSFNNAGATNVVSYAKLNSNGSVGTWSSGTHSLPANVWGATSVIANGYIYNIAGNNSSGPTTTTYYASTQRVQVGGSLDLVGYAGQTLATPGEQGYGATGGSITAGDITAVGTLQVDGQGSFSRGIVANGNLVDNGYVDFQNSANSTSSFQVQNSSGGQVLSVDTTNGKVVLGTANTVGGTLVIQDGGSSNAGTIQLQGALTGSATYQLPNVSGTQVICTTLSTVACDSVYQAAGNYLLQNPVANDTSTSNFAGYQYSFTQSNTGAAGNLQLTNSGTNPSLDVVGSGNPSGTNAILVINNSAGTPSGNSLDIQTGGVNELSVDYNGNINQINGSSTTDTINGQTISAAANFTGTVTATTSVLTPLVDTPSGTTTLNIGTTNATAGIHLNQTSTIAGSLNFTTTNAVNFTTPLGATVPTRINIPVYDPGAFGQILAFGLPNGANTQSRAISILDDRATTNNQPVLAVFSPNENNTAGIDWQGASTTAYFGAYAPNTTTSSPNSELTTGNVTGGSGLTTGNVTVQSGNGSGTSSNSGNVYVDSGTATGTPGSVNIGVTNTTAVNVGGNSASTISIQGGTGGTTINDTSGNLTLKTTTSGTLAVTSAGALNETGAAASTINIGSNTLAVTSSNFNVSTGGVLNVVGGSAGYQIGGAAATGNYLRGNGTSFVSSAIQSGDIPVCTGSCNYISNQTGTQSSANFNIQSAATTSVGGVIQGASSQTADLFDLRDSASGNLQSFSAGGNQEAIGYYDNGIGGIGQFGNALKFSENQNNAVWTATNVVASANFAVAPDGNTTGTKLVGTGNSNVLEAETAVITDPGTYTFSVWLKQVSGAANTGLCIFATGGTASPSTCTATAVTPNSTDWQRFSVTQAIGGSGATSITAEILPGNGSTATIYSWGAQLVLASVPEVYIRTNGTVVAPSGGVVSNGGAYISSQSATDIPLVVQAAPSQSGNLFNLVDSNGNPVTQITAGGNLEVTSAVDVEAAGTLNLGTSIANNVAIGSGTAPVALNGNTTVASGKNLTLTSGQYSQTYSSGTAGNAQTLSFTNSNTGAGVTVQGIDLTPTNTAAPSSGTNTLNGVDFAAAGALGANDTTNGINFESATGYTNFIKTPTYTLSSSGAVSGVTGLTMASGNFLQNGTGTFTTGSGAVQLNGSTTIASGANLTLTSGSITQTYSSGSASNAQTLTVTNSNAGASSIAVNGTSYSLVGTATSGGTNTNSALYFANPTAQANNVYDGLNFAGTGYTNVLVVNGSSIINGSGVLQSAGLSGTYSNALTLSSASNVFTGSTYNNLTLTSAADGFTVAGGTTSRTLTVTGANITIGNVIKPTAAGTLTVQSNGANALTIDAGAAAAVNIGNTSANAVNIGNGSITTAITGSETVSKSTTLGSTASGSLFTNNGATNNFECAYTGASGTLNLTTAGKTVNDCTAFSITDTASTTLTSASIGAPTAGAGQVIYINNLSASTNSITVLGAALPVGDTEMLVYDGTNWTAGASASSGIVKLQDAYNNSAGANPSILTTTGNQAVTVQAANSGGQTGAQEIFGVHAAHASDTIGGAIVSAYSYGLGVNLGTDTAQSGYDIQLGGNADRVLGVISATVANQRGGNLKVEAGNANGSTTGGIGGELDLFGGNAAGTGSNAGGLVNIQGGTASNNATAIGGAVTITGGSAGATAGSMGGAVSLTGGAGTGTGTGAAGNTATVAGGAAAGSGNNAGGATTVKGGAGINGGAGGQANVNGGAGGGTGAGGAVSILGGNGGTSTTGGAGGNITLQGGNAGGTGNNNGGTISLTAGTATGTGSPGVVSISTPVFNSASETFTQTSNNQAFNSTTDPALQTNLDSKGTIVMNVTGAFTGATITMPSPTNSVAGRMILVSAASGSVSFTLAATGMSSVNMAAGSTATLIWNGSAWSGTTTASSLQQVYNNTSTAPASIITTSTTKNILFQAGAGDDNANVFQVGNSAAAPVIAINTTNTATGVNVADNGGVENGSGCPPTGWSAYTGAGATVTVCQNTTASHLASGSGSIDVNISAGGTGGGGTYNDLGATALSNNTTYNVSFNILVSTGTAPTMVVEYLRDGTNVDATCTTPTNGTPNNTSFFKYVCSFQTDGASITTGNDLRIRQSDTTARHIYIDNLFVGAQNSTGTADTGDLQVGGPLSQGLTLFTLDTFAADPFTGTINQNLYGSMYYNTTLGRIQCYESDGWGSCGAAPNTNLILEPEYVGAVLNPGGTTVCSGCSTSLSAQNTHIGTMTANICSGTSRQSINTTICGATDEFNYYQWTTSQVTSQSYSIFVKYQLPPTFGGFASSSTINMEAESSDTTNANVYYTLFDNSGNECAPGTSNTDPVDHDRTLVTTSNNVWQKVALVADETNTGTSGCSFAPNDVITFRVDLYSANNANAFAGQITFTMLGK